MPTILEDFDAILAYATPVPPNAPASPELTAASMRHSQRVDRVRAFIVRHTPWLPPRVDGFGEWVEYNGTNGPRVDEQVRALMKSARLRKEAPFGALFGHEHEWSEVVAYCVKDKTP